MSGKGRYSGCHMTIYGAVLPGAASLAHSFFLAGNLSERAKQRLKIIDWHKRHGKNISLTARHFGLTRHTVRQWMRRLIREGPQGLNDHSRRPHCLRQPITLIDVVAEIIKLRRQYPAWSKYKIRSLLPEHLKTSASTVGRVLKRRGMIDARISRKRAKAAKRPKTRFLRGLKIANPGDMIQMDTKHIVLSGGRRFYQFTAIDVLTKTKIMSVYPSESSKNGKDFLEHCLNTFPFSIKSVQSDNGAPFQKEFQGSCQEKSLTHYFIYPRCPKQNSYVEISQGADKREFYQQGNVCSDLEAMRQRIKKWEYVWNNIRPHQALNYLTPNEYLAKWQTGRLPTRDVITLQT